MAVRTFTADDSTRIWEHLNEVGSAINTASDDSGWIDLPTTGADSGFTRYMPVQYRKVGKQIFIRGGVHREGIEWATNTKYVIGTLPLEVAPESQTAISIFSDPGYPDRPPVVGVVSEAGKVSLLSPSGTSYWAVLGGSWVIG